MAVQGKRGRPNRRIRLEVNSSRPRNMPPRNGRKKRSNIASLKPGSLLPTGLDPHGARTLRRTLERLREEKRTVFLVSHNLSQGLELSDRWIILARGRMIDQGNSARTDASAFERSYFDRLDLHRPARVRA